jgi:hypothetical protein
MDMKNVHSWLHDSRHNENMKIRHIYQERKAVFVRAIRWDDSMEKRWIRLEKVMMLINMLLGSVHAVLHVFKTSKLEPYGESLE